MPAMNLPLPRKKLPLGIQTFAKLREQGCYYVDKTRMALDLIDQGGYYFLSRPRRFGKSLLLDTLAELFEGNRSLFEGLYANARWDWSVKYPVIRISFGGGVLRSRDGLDAKIRSLLRISSTPSKSTAGATATTGLASRSITRLM